MDLTETAVSATTKCYSHHPKHPGALRYLAVVAEGGTAETSSLSLIENFVYPQPVRFIAHGQGYIVPANCMIYLLAGEDAVAESWLATAGTLLPEQAQVEKEIWRFYYVAETAVCHKTAVSIQVGRSAPTSSPPAT